MAIDTDSAVSISASPPSRVTSPTGLGQPGPDVLLATPLLLTQPVQSLAGRGLDKVAPRGAHFVEVHRGPARPDVLHDVLGVVQAAQHAIGGADHRRPVFREQRRVVHAVFPLSL
jgi:hypothetical protein